MTLENRNIYIRDLSSQDIERIMEIETGNENSWSRESFLFEFEKSSHSRNIALCINGLIVAYCVAWVILDEVHIGQITVDKGHRRQGNAEKLLNYLFYEYQSLRSFHLEVSKKNYTALSLYKKMGFKEKAIRKNYYKDGSDAVLMEKELQGIT